MPSEQLESVKRYLVNDDICVFLYKEPASRQLWFWSSFNKAVFVTVSPNFMLVVKTWGHEIMGSPFSRS